MFDFRNAPKAFDFKLLDRLMTWILVCISSPDAFKNLYLIAKLFEVLFLLNPNIQPRNEALSNMLMSHPLSISHLPSALMKFYTGILVGYIIIYENVLKLFIFIAIESFGASSEYYNKFTFRNCISSMLKSIWESPMHRSSVIKESK